MWLVYLMIFVGCALLPLCCVGFITKPEKDITFFDRYSTQTIKGIAISLVVLCHFMGKFGGGVTLFTPFGGIGVMIFIMLAAYGLNESWNAKGSSGWWRKRLIAVFVPYAVVQLCLYWSTYNFSALDLLLDILLIKPRYAYGWYLSYLLIWYVIYYIIMKIPMLRKHKIAVIGVVALGMFLLFDEIRAEQSLSFLCGIILSEHKTAEYKKQNVIVKFANWKCGVLLVAVGILFLALKQVPLVRQAPALVFHFVQLMIKFPCGLGICFIVTSLLRVLNLRFFYYVGAIAYEFYLIHGYVLSKVSLTISGAIIFIAVSTGMAVLLWMFMKKTSKLQRKLLRL